MTLNFRLSLISIHARREHNHFRICSIITRFLSIFHYEIKVLFAFDSHCSNYLKTRKCSKLYMSYDMTKILSYTHSSVSKQLYKIEVRNIFQLCNNNSNKMIYILSPSGCLALEQRLLSFKCNRFAFFRCIIIILLNVKYSY